MLEAFTLTGPSPVSLHLPYVAAGFLEEQQFASAPLAQNESIERREREEAALFERLRTLAPAERRRGLQQDS